MEIGEALAAAGVNAASLGPDEAQALDEQGYVMLRGVVRGEALERLRARFEACYLPPEQWPFPRERGMRHALMDDDAQTRRFCLSPRLLAAAAHLLAAKRFFFAGVQGRDPLPGGGQQYLHRDWPEDAPGMVQMLAFLDDFGPKNGGTRIVPGTHTESGAMNDYAIHITHPRQRIMEGEGGDVLVHHGRLVHSGMRNESGASRRSLLISYRDHATYGQPPEVRDFTGLPEIDRYLLGAG